MNVSPLIGVILGIVLILIAAPFFIDLSGLLGTYTQETECKSVVNVGSLLTQYANVGIQSVKPEQMLKGESVALCPVINLRLREDFRTEAARTAITDEMISCYGKYRKGEVNLFENKQGRTLYCAMCTYITFDEPDREIDGIIQTLNERTLPGGQTYASYLLGEDEYFEGDELTIRTDTPHAIYFIYMKDYSIFRISGVDRIASMTAGAFGGAAAGVAISFVFGGPAFWIAGGLMFAGIAAGTSITLPPAGQDSWSGHIMLAPYDEESLASLGCDLYGADVET